MKKMQDGQLYVTGENSARYRTNWRLMKTEYSNLNCHFSFLKCFLASKVIVCSELVYFADKTATEV